jgi:NADPH2:quinone reductase
VKEIHVETHGGPEQLKIHDCSSRTPGPNHVLVRLSVAGVNFMDTGVRRGILWQDKTPPFVPGVEGAGRVAALGEGVN